MSKVLPKKCLTCKFCEVNELDDLLCLCTNNNHNLVEYDYVCDDYELSKEVEKDAKMGMW